METKTQSPSKLELPKIGQEIYVSSAYYVYRGEDDFEGGKAIINKIDISKTLPKSHRNYIMVGIKGRENTMYNYKSLIAQQKELQEEYQEQVAYANPDMRAEFNKPDADWKEVI